MSSLGGHNIRGRRRGRPPGVKSARSDSARGRSTQLQRSTASAASAASAASTVSTASNTNDEPVRRGRGRGRGRPPRRVVGVRNTPSAASSIGGSSRQGVSESSTSSATAPSVINPMLFAHRAAQQGVDKSDALDEYLGSFVTLPDDAVLSSLPKEKPKPKRRAPGSITIPECSQAGPTAAQPTKDELVAGMQKRMGEWIDEMASNMNRISFLRRKGMLRDAESQAPAIAHAAEAKIEPNTQLVAQSSGDPDYLSDPFAIPLLPPSLAVPEHKSREPRREKSWRDQLLTDIIDRHKEITVASRRRRATLRKCSRQIEKQDDEKKAKLGIYKRPQQAEKAMRDHQKRIAKWTVQQVMKKWAYIESIMSEQRQIEEDERRTKQDKKVLFSMLERSTQLLEEQRAGFNPTASVSSYSAAATSTAPSLEMASSNSDTNASTPAEESDVEFDSESESDSGAELRDIIAEQDVDVEELRRRYFESSNSLQPDTLIDAAADGYRSSADEDACISPEQTDEEFSSESASGDSDNEMSGLAGDQDIPIEKLLEQYRQQEATPSSASPIASVDHEDTTAVVTSNGLSSDHLKSEGSSAGEEDGDSGEKPRSAGPGIEELVSAQDEHMVEQPFLLRGNLREYQRQGLDWLSSLHQHEINGILADEMGLGKTIQTIALLAHLACHKGIWGPHLVIVPTSVLLNWEQEFHRWLPGFKVLTYYGSRAERKLKRKGWSKSNAFHVCVTSYQLAIQDSSVFKRKPWYYMILDEAQAIKNFRSQRWQTLLGFKSACRLLLTGTPLQNSLIELWSLMYFLMPKEFASEGANENGDNSGFAGLDRFREWFSQPLEKLLAAQPEIAAPVGLGDSGNDKVSFNTLSFLQGTGQARQDSSAGVSEAQREAQQAVQKLHAVLRPHILRRLKQDVETQLPDKLEHVVYCRLAKRQRFLYDDFMSRAQTRETLLSGAYLGVMSCLMQLRKVCNHPDLFETRPIVTSWATSGAPIAAYRRTESLIRRMLHGDQSRAGLADEKPWMSSNSRSWELRGLVVTSRELRKDALAWRSTMALDATSVILQHGLKKAKSALQLVASQELSWEELQMRPFAAKYRFVNDSAKMLEYSRRSSQQEKWMRISALNAKRINGHAQRPIYGAGTLRVCSFVKSLHQRSCDPVKDMVLTGQQRLERYRSTIENFVFATPHVAVVNTGSDLAAIYPHLRPENPDSWIKELLPNILHMKRRVGQRTRVLRPLEVRQQIAFPEPFLLQYDCGKLQALDALLSKLVQGGHRALIFTQMSKVLDILEKWLNLHGYRYLRLDGATPVEQRWRLTERFNYDPKWTVFISSTRAGGLGINLTGADTVIFYDSDWNHAMDAQCQDRCHRIGQQREVHIYRLISEKTIEEAIWRKQCEKRWLDHVVIQEGYFDPKRASRNRPGTPSSQAPQEPSKSQEAAALGVGDWYELASTVLAQSNNAQLPGRSLVQHVASSHRRTLTEREAARAIASAEDEADAAALKMAITEVAQADALDLGEEPPAAVADAPSPAAKPSIHDRRGGDSDEGGDGGGDNDDDAVGHIDDYMFRFLSEVVYSDSPC